MRGGNDSGQARDRRDLFSMRGVGGWYSDADSSRGTALFAANLEPGKTTMVPYTQSLLQLT